MGEMRLDASDTSFLGRGVRTDHPVHSDVKGDLDIDVAAIWEVVREVVREEWYWRDNLIAATQDEVDDNDRRSGQHSARHCLEHAVQTEEAMEHRLPSVRQQSTRVKSL
jgi:hypothetical protein